MQWPLQIHPANGEQVSPQDSTNYMHHFAVQIWDRRIYGKSYYGVEVTMDVYDFYLQPEQHSSASIWIYDMGDGRQTSITGFVLGWHVHPALYKDSDTHFVTWWPGNGSHPGGCYNSQCPGFVRTGSSIAPGDVINPVSEVMGKKQYITIRASKHKSSGDWQIYYGFNGPAQLVGYFPKSLFPKLEKNQFNIALPILSMECYSLMRLLLLVIVFLMSYPLYIQEAEVRKPFALLKTDCSTK
ncbi:uncharacterized protein LOC124695113 [Lolium rigidum]|uniref:uncharacterized protein LOC124695113 n=1 Tax=Lolium rigidum TaxID=89674 RepID=UPI001F5CE62A|nr:uncharacterized protein LOC124695113 [Lolium rigidum]